MDFDDSPDEAAFRSAARTWLQSNAKPKSEAGSGRRDPAAHVEDCKRWQRTLHEGGWAGLTWPVEFGGQGATPIESAIFAQEQAAFDVATGIFAVGIGMVGPTLIAHGTTAQKDRYLGPLLRGDEVWCQLFSEPGAGSDLAGLTTRAVPDGDDWVVNGQKVWTSGAHHSDWGILLARTDPSVPKHRGITYFLVDMRSPGIDVRPLRQINGAAHFNEVFLTDVRVPGDQVVGPVNGGWGPVLTTLANERTFIGGGAGVGWDDLAGLAGSTGGGADPRMRQELAAAYSRWAVMRYVGFRVQTALSHGRPPGPESSILKLLYSQHLSRTADVVMAMQGVSGTLTGPDAEAGGFWADYFLTQWASRIGGGTDQIQRNVIGERVLGLPAEPRVDKQIPFDQLGRDPGTRG